MKDARIFSGYSFFEKNGAIFIIGESDEMITAYLKDKPGIVVEGNSVRDAAQKLAEIDREFDYLFSNDA